MISVCWGTTSIASDDLFLPRLDRLLRGSQALVSLGNLKLCPFNVQCCLLHGEFLNVSFEGILQLLTISIFDFLALFTELFDKHAGLLLLLFFLMAMIESLRSLLLDSHDLVVLNLLKCYLTALFFSPIILEELV